MKTNATLTSLKKKYTKEETNALRFRKAGDFLNYLRRLKEARRLRMEYYELHKHHNGVETIRKKVDDDDEISWN